MRSGIRGVLAGALALIALQTLVSTEASGRVSGLFELPGRWARRFLDPTIPAIPDRNGSDAPATSVGAGVRGPLPRTGPSQPARPAIPSIDLNPFL